MNAELLSILSAIERDKGIDREVLIQAVESALSSAAKKSLGVEEATVVTVTIDRKTGQLSIVSDDRPIDGVDFSRIAAQTAKQVIIQKIREAEREVVFIEYQGRVGDIVNGTVHRFERGDIIVEMGRAEAVLPRAERIPHEEYQQGDQLQGYVMDVRKSVKGPSIILSRTHEGFIRGLFALEVPEISEGIVEVRGLAREAGDRTKIAVASKDEKVDCVGACVGMRGTRVKNIVRELHGEKIDIIRWQDDIKEFIAAALSPAKITEIRPSSEMKQALVVVDDDQLSLAIGKRGQNVRLASKLTGWELEIQSKTQLAAEQIELSAVPGVGPSMEEKLKAAGIASVRQLSSMKAESLSGVPGVGVKTAERLIESAKRALKTHAQSVADREAAAAAAPASAAEEQTQAEARPGSDESRAGEAPAEEGTEEAVAEEAPAQEPLTGTEAQEEVVEEAAPAKAGELAEAEESAEAEKTESEEAQVEEEPSESSASETVSEEQSEEEKKE